MSEKREEVSVLRVRLLRVRRDEGRGGLKVKKVKVTRWKMMVMECKVDG